MKIPDLQMDIDTSDQKLTKIEEMMVKLQCNFAELGEQINAQKLEQSELISTYTSTYTYIFL